MTSLWSCDLTSDHVISLVIMWPPSDHVTSLWSCDLPVIMWPPSDYVTSLMDYVTSQWSCDLLVIMWPRWWIMWPTSLPLRCFHCIHPNSLDICKRSWFCDIKDEDDTICLAIVYCRNGHVFFWACSVPYLYLEERHGVIDSYNAVVAENQTVGGRDSFIPRLSVGGPPRALVQG